MSRTERVPNEPVEGDGKRLSADAEVSCPLGPDEKLARHLFSLSCHLAESEPAHGHQGWQAAPLNFYWKETYVEALREAAARLAPDTHARPKNGAMTPLNASQVPGTNHDPN